MLTRLCRSPRLAEAPMMVLAACWPRGDIGADRQPSPALISIRREGWCAHLKGALTGAQARQEASRASARARPSRGAGETTGDDVSRSTSRAAAAAVASSNLRASIPRVRGYVPCSVHRGTQCPIPMKRAIFHGAVRREALRAVPAVSVRIRVR